MTSGISPSKQICNPQRWNFEQFSLIRKNDFEATKRCSRDGILWWSSFICVPLVYMSNKVQFICFCCVLLLIVTESSYVLSDIPLYDCVFQEIYSRGWIIHIGHTVCTNMIETSTFSFYPCLNWLQNVVNFLIWMCSSKCQITWSFSTKIYPSRRFLL